MNPFEEQPSTKTCSAYLNKCDETGKEVITFQCGSHLEVFYPSTIAKEKCQGEYRIKNISANIKSIIVKCDSCYIGFYEDDMSFRLTDQCAKYHATQITAEIDISKEIVVPYFLHLYQTLLNALKEGEGDSHIIQLPGYEFLSFKCTITKIFDRFELYIENFTYTVAINGNQQSYWTKLNIVNAVSNEWFIEKIDFSFNPAIVWQQFNEISNRNNLSTSSASTVRPSAPIASANSQQPFNPFPSASYLWRTASPAISETKECEQDLEFLILL
uniref:Uncharacterized protein n=1 Tax=Panagrolaimus sp. PS1159 TaxID=55785 RepID=A0AC35FMR8_9BILA